MDLRQLEKAEITLKSGMSKKDILEHPKPCNKFPACTEPCTKQEWQTGPVTD